jgi:hypothetical protein
MPSRRVILLYLPDNSDLEPESLQSSSEEDLESELESDSESDLDLEPEIILGDLVSDIDSESESEVSFSEDSDDLRDQIALANLSLDQFHAKIPDLKKVPLSREHDDGTRVQCLSLISEKVHHARIKEKTGISQSGQSKLRKKALERG